MVEFILPTGVFFLMFGLGLSLHFTDFTRIARFPRAFIAGVLSMLILVPLLGLGLVELFDVPPILAVGILLIATAPGGLFSNLITHIGGGDLALSVALTATLSLVYIVEIPILVGLMLPYFMGQSVAVTPPVQAIAFPLFALTLLPLTIGMTAAHYANKAAEAVRSPIRTLSAIFLFAAFAFIAVEQRESLIASLQSVFIPVLLLNLGAVSIGFLIAHFIGLGAEQTIAITVEHSVRQEGPATFIAVTLLGSQQMALPLILNGAMGLIVSTAFIVVMKRYWPSRFTKAAEQL